MQWLPDIGWTCGEVPHSQNNCKCAIDRKHRPWNNWVLDTRQHFLGSEIRFTAVHKESATPPHVHPTSRYVIACDQFYQAFPCVRTASSKCWIEKAWVWGSNLTAIHNTSTTVQLLVHWTWKQHGTYKHLGFTTTLSCPEYFSWSTHVFLIPPPTILFPSGTRLPFHCCILHQCS